MAIHSVPLPVLYCVVRGMLSSMQHDEMQGGTGLWEDVAGGRQQQYEHYVMAATGPDDASASGHLHKVHRLSVRANMMGCVFRAAPVLLKIVVLRPVLEFVPGSGCAWMRRRLPYRHTRLP